MNNPFDFFRPTVGVGIDYGTFKSMIATTADPHDEPKPVRVTVDAYRGGYQSYSLPTRAIVKVGEDRLIKSLGLAVLTAQEEILYQVYPAKHFKLYAGTGWPQKEYQIMQLALGEKARELRVEELSSLVLTHLIEEYENTYKDAENKRVNH